MSDKKFLNKIKTLNITKSKSPSDSPKCPDCGGDMVEATVVSVGINLGKCKPGRRPSKRSSDEQSFAM